MMPGGDHDTLSLYEAASKGCVETLQKLIQENPNVLSKVSSTSFDETPLHISASLGHLEFTKTLLSHHPKMAAELDSLKRSPLHLASAEGHSEIVKALLEAITAVCLVCDEDGRTPLHLAAMRGRTEVIKELVDANLESTKMLLDGDTVLHLCVRYNHLDALMLLVKLIKDDELLIMGNQEGNTILHLAVMLKQVETVKYLISIRKIRSKATSKENKMGLTALDVLENSPRDFKTQEIRSALMEAGHVTKSHTDTTRSSLSSQGQMSISSKLISTAKLWLAKFMTYLDYQGGWIKKQRGSLMVVATVIATISFQTAVNPPGGVLQADYNNGHNLDYDSLYKECLKKFRDSTKCQLPGNALLGYVVGHDYFLLSIYNTVAFVASLSVMLLIISGFPLEERFFMWLLTLAMGIAFTFMALTYKLSLEMVSPINFLTYQGHDMYNVGWKMTEFGYWLLIVAGALHTIRLLYWIGYELNKFLKKIRFYSKTMSLIKMLGSFQFRMMKCSSEENPTSSA